MLVLPFEAISVAEDEQVHRSPYTELTDTVNNNSKKALILSFFQVRSYPICLSLRPLQHCKCIHSIQ